MQVVLQTPSELVVHDSRWNLVLMGSLFSASGFGFIWLRWTHPDGWSGNAGPWLVYLVGGLFGIIGLLIIYFSADRRYIIDRSAKTARIVVQRLVNRQTTTLPFDTIDDVALEQSAPMRRSSSSSDTPSGPTWRVVFLMKDGSRIPWTPYSTSMRVTQETCAAAVRSFGGWSGRPDHPVPPSIASPSLISHPAATNIGCLAAFLSIFVAVGLGIFSLQVYRIITYEPVSARVYSTDIKTISGDKGSTYAPLVNYGYTWKGTAYQASQVNPIQISSSYSWAQGITKQFHPGSVVTAYVSPTHPEKAYLLRHASIIPLFFVVVPVLFAMLFSWVIRAQRAQVVFTEQHLVPVVNART